MRDFPPQIFKAFSEVKEKRESCLEVANSSSLLHDVRKDSKNPKKKKFSHKKRTQ